MTDSGNRDARGKTRHDRLVEVLAGWKAIGVDFGVIVGDNLANETAGWALLQQAIADSGLTVHLALGNHDWVEQTPSGGGSHPVSCYNLRPDQQDPNCPNIIYFLDHMAATYGSDRPWYSFEQDGVVFAFLADDLFDPRGTAGDGVSDVTSEQFNWFKNLVAANTTKPMVVFTHHPVFNTVFGSGSPTSSLNRLGWRPKEGESLSDTVAVTNGSTTVTRAGGAIFDLKRVTVGSEFQVQGDPNWYNIAAINGDQLTLTTPFLGGTDPATRFWAGSNFNELTQIMKDPSNQIEVVMSGHTARDFQHSFGGLSQLEVINGKTYAFSGTIHPVESTKNARADFYVGSPVVTLTQNEHTGRIIPGSELRTPTGTYLEILDIAWASTLGGKSTLTLEANPSTGHLNLLSPTRRTDPFTETRVLTISGSGPPPTIENFNYATRWRSGTLLSGDFNEPGFPVAEVIGASLSVNGSDASLTPSAGHGVALYGLGFQEFYAIEAELKRVAGGGGGIAFRAVDGQNYYYFELDEVSQSFKLGKSVNGVLTTLAEVQPGAALESEYVLKARVEGSRIQTFVDGEAAIMIDDTTFAQGRYGLFSRSAAGSDFEDLEVIGDIEPYVDVECSDGIDNDGDGAIDFPSDPGCGAADTRYESPQCQDGIDNDGDGSIDFDGGVAAGLPQGAFSPDTNCLISSGNREKVTACGLGPELTVILSVGLLWRLRRTRRGL